MSQEERSAYIGLLVNIFVDVLMIWCIWDLHRDGAFSGADAPQVWARTVLWVIPMAIERTVSLSLVAKAMWPEKGPTSDERDQRYHLRGMATTMVFATFGILGGIIALALGSTMLTALNIIFFSMCASALAGDCVRILSYRVWG